MARVEFKVLKELFLPVLALSKPIVQKIVDEKVIANLKLIGKAKEKRQSSY